jgi:molybdenum transport protein
MTLLNDHELYEYIREDLPYFDLTTHLLELEPQKARLRIVTREKLIVACSEEAARIGELLGCRVTYFVASQTPIQAGDVILEFQGSHNALHQAWKTSQVLLEYACAMATHAHAMSCAAKSVNPSCEILVTRKSHPFTKKFAIRALLCGGVVPHRLGLSESVLIFDHHRALYDNAKAFEEALKTLKSRCVEKKLVIESTTLEDAKAMLCLGADVIQMDKADPKCLSKLVAYKNNHYPHAAILAAGGIYRENVIAFAQTGVNAIVTSALYTSGVADLSAQWSRE